MELIRDQVKVEFEVEELCERLQGDNEQENPEDVELLRLSVSVRPRDDAERARYAELYVTHGGYEGWEWVPCYDASYCTLFPASASPEEKRDALELVMSRVKPEIDQFRPIKRLTERLSHIEPAWLYDSSLCV